MRLWVKSRGLKMWWERLISWSKEWRDVKRMEICRSRNRWTNWCFAAPRHRTVPSTWKEVLFHTRQASYCRYYRPSPLHPLKMTFCLLLFPFIPLAFVSLSANSLCLMIDGLTVTRCFHLSVEPHYELFLAPWHHKGVERASCVLGVRSHPCRPPSFVFLGLLP